jgi:hypothetical protein
MVSTDEDPVILAKRLEEPLKELIRQEKEDRKKILEALRIVCICTSCPTYTRCAQQAGESLFCAHGGSFRCITDEVACLCPNCPVLAEMGLNHRYFCTRGSEALQRYDDTVLGFSKPWEMPSGRSACCGPFEIYKYIPRNEVPRE